MSEVPSIVTSVDLLTKSSFNKSALILLEISVAKLFVNVLSALVLLDTSAAKLFVKLVSAAALVAASLVTAVVLEAVLTST